MLISLYQQTDCNVFLILMAKNDSHSICQDLICMEKSLPCETLNTTEENAEKLLVT